MRYVSLDEDSDFACGLETHDTYLSRNKSAVPKVYDIIISRDNSFHPFYLNFKGMEMLMY